MELLERPFWIFDLDGTITLAAHDFARFKREQGLPEDAPILEVLPHLSEVRAREVRCALDAWEAEVARGARVAPDVPALLEHLLARGHTLGLLTRNSRVGTALTLEATGLGAVFPESNRVCREDVPPKPDPAGVLALAARWGAAPDQLVMVGDYRFDIEAGQAAGAATVLVDRAGQAAGGMKADVVVRGLDALLRRDTAVRSA
jgi:HAD superfamily hydrolase (TIGR01509 family)